MTTDSTTQELPQGIALVQQNGLDAYRIDTELCTGLVYPYGAHVAEWTPAGQQPVLWMSKQADFEPGKAIRGGIPICWPWFGPGAEGNRAPGHGFARLAPWTLVEAEVSDAGEARLVFEITGDALPEQAEVPADTIARYAVSFGSMLNLSLTIRAGEQPIAYEEALHTYFAVGDIHQVSLEGLDGASYLDKVGGGEHIQQGPVKFTTETDRIYFSAETVRLLDPSMGRQIEIQKAESADTVVWNPWSDKASAMGDFGNDEWLEMCCVESVNCLASQISLAEGEEHTMTTTILVP